jgi:hypothetical protein
MPDIKAVAIKVPSLKEGQGSLSLKILREGFIFPDYLPGPIPDSSVEASEYAISSPGEISAHLVDQTPLVILELAGEGFEETLLQVLEESSHRTSFAIAAPDKLAFYGYGFLKSGTSGRKAESIDILPTLAQIGEFYLSGQVKGRILFEAIKNPNFKQAQIGKLKAALDRLEKVIKRENREPWDKHDCA